MKFRLKLKCDSVFNEKTHLVIRDAANKIIFEKPALALVAGNTEEFEVYFPKPGSYQVWWDEGISTPQFFTIDSTWAGIEFSKNGLYCDGTLRWEKSKFLDRFKFSSFEVDLIDADKKLDSDRSSIGLASVIQHYPEKVQVRAQDREDGYQWISPVITLQHAPACHELTYPENGSKASLSHDTTNLIFAWKQSSDHPLVRFEMSPSPEFSEIVVQKETDRNFLKIKFSKKGTWYWRIIDQGTRETSDVYTIKVK